EQQIALALEILDLVRGRFVRFPCDRVLLAQPRVTLERLARVEDAILEIEQLVPQQQLALRKADLRVAQGVQVLYERRFRVDRVPLYRRVGEAQDEVSRLDVSPAFHKDFLDPAALLDVQVHRRDGLDDAIEG